MYDAVIKQILLFSAFLFSFQLAAQFYPPQLEPVPLPSKKSKSIGSYAVMGIDDRQQLCLVEKERGFYCYDGKHLTNMANEALGLVALGNLEERRLILSINNQVYQLKGGAISLFDVQPKLGMYEIITGFYPVDEHTFFMATTDGIYEYDGSNIAQITETPSKVYIYFTRKLDDTLIEMATSDGVIRVDLDSGEMTYRLKGIKVYSLYENFALTAYGIFEGEQKISHKVFYHANKTTHGEILLSGPEGICFLKDTILCHAQNSNGKVYQTLSDGFGNLWATTNKGLMFSPFSSVEYINQKTGLLSDNVLSIVRYQEELYVGTEKGINVLDISTGALQVLPKTQQDKVTALLVDNDNYLWVGTNKGLYRYHLHEKRKEKTVLNVGPITWLLEKNHQIIASTYKRGIFVFDKFGFLLKDKIEVYTKKIGKISTCNAHETLYLGSQYNGLRKLDNNFKVSNYTGKNNHAIFSCYKDQPVVVNAKNELMFLGAELEEKGRFPMLDSINSLIQTESHLWVLHNQYITKWYSEKQNMRFDANLETLYHNIALGYDKWLFAGSSEGLAVVDIQFMQSYEPQASEVLISSSIDNTSGALTIEPRLNNLAAIFNDQNIMYRTSNNDNFILMKSYENLVFPVGLPSGMQVEFKGVKDNIGITVATVFENKEVALSKKIKNAIFHYLSLAVYLIGLILVFLMFYFLFRKKDEIDENNVIEKTSTLTSYIVFSKQLEAIQKNSKDEHLLFLQTCNTMIVKNARVYKVKELSKQLNVDSRKIERTIRKFFGSGSVKKYQEFYLQYHDEHFRDSDNKTSRFCLSSNTL